MRDLLGGKGAGLAEMTNAGLPVPPGFTITTEACNDYFAAGQKLPDGLWDDVLAAVKEVEQETGKGFGNPANPLLVSVRSGAKFSMPGMMDTVLNLGLNDKTLHGLIALTGNERFGWDAYRRFIQMFGRIVMDVDGEKFDHALDAAKQSRGVTQDTDLDAAALQELVGEFLSIVHDATGRDFPTDPLEQLDLAIKAVFASWFGKRAHDYREYNKISHNLGTAVNVVTMVFGNMGDDSGTGVAFTRNPNTGEKVLFGEYLTNAQGEDVVAGIRTPLAISQMRDQMPEIYAQFDEIAGRLERHYRDMQDLEFTIERGRLFMLQTRSGKRTATAAVQIAADMVEEGIITEREALGRIEPAHVDQLLRDQFDPNAKSSATEAHSGPERVARRGRGQGRVQRRSRVRDGPAGREGHPRPHRDVTGRFPRHGRGSRRAHSTWRRDLARSRSRAPDRQAVRRGMRGADHRLRHEERARRRPGLQRRGVDLARRDHGRGVHRRTAHDTGALRGPGRATEGARMGRPGAASRGLDECRQAGGGRDGAALRRAGHWPVPDGAHVPRRGAAGHRP